MMAAQGSGVFTQFASRTTPCSVHHPRRCRGPSGRRVAIISRASETAAALLVEGKRVYEAGDRLAAMNIYEKALKEGPALSKEQRLAALYGSIAVHASFGDVELAQMVLRDAIQAGLDYEAALEDPNNPEINSSQQILIQLTRFNKQFKRSIADRSEDIASQSAKAKAAGRKAANSSKVGADADLSRLLGPGMGKTDARALDASPAAIAKRVAVVVLAGIVLGVGLFFAGLEYMFPKI